MSRTKKKLTRTSCQSAYGKNALPVVFWYACSRRYPSRRSRAVRRGIGTPSRVRSRASPRALHGLAGERLVVALAGPGRRGHAQLHHEPHVQEDEREDAARDDEHVQRVEARQRLPAELGPG